MAGIFLTRAKSTAFGSDPKAVPLFDKSKSHLVWRDQTLFPKDMHDAFFELLAKFELLYWMESASKYFVPSFLGDEASPAVKEIKNANLVTKRRMFRFQWMLPVGLFHRLQIQALAFYSSDQEPFQDYHPWKSGLILMWGMGYVILEERELELQLCAKGKTLAWIDKKMQEILKIAKELIETNFPGMGEILCTQ